ncbi:hypothetical protein [Mongoliimonas terrestris]|uniref:hypothetical protein n=1 Tax=Mongoliimonas terrestris TaxID=1709001 RepID=UPI0009498D00|nr:hypothetical protein [Mongoliimonas terrestris]
MGISRPLRPLACLALVVAAGACSPGLDMVMDDVTTGTADALVLTADGLPGLPVGTAYSETAIEAALPGFDASPITMATETETLSAIALFRDGLQMVQVLPGSGGRIGAVHAVSTRLRGPGGEHVGMTIGEAQVAAGSCRIGAGNWSGMPICPSRAAPNVSLVFATTGIAQTAVEAISTATLQRMIWTPPEPEGS